MKHKRFLEIAEKASKKSDHKKHKMGCVIAKKNKILGIGYNTPKTHFKSPHFYKSIHAEFMAALRANFDINGATAYIFRQHKNGTWALAKPCRSCLEFLMERGIKEVVYSFQGSFKQEELKR